MGNEQQGYFIWQKEQDNYSMMNERREGAYPSIPLKVSEVIRDQRPLILQDIWCKKKGFINREIGKNERVDEQIAKQLNVW